MINNNFRPKPSVQLALNGKPIYLFNFIATTKVSRQEQDMSGQKSSTKKSDKGIKAKEITITGLIPFREKAWLTDLFTLAEAMDEKGEQVKYRITNISAEAINMREVQFSGEITAVEQSVQGWNVSFTLREVNSVSEKKEQRQQKPKVRVQSEKVPKASDETEDKPSENGAKSQEGKEESTVDKYSRILNDMIGE